MDAIVKHFILLASLMSIAEGRILKLYSSDDHLISDGTLTDICPSSCDHQYGFLPCAENAAGYFFLIVVYRLLLAVGGLLISSGSEVLFRIMKAKECGGIIFRILMALPSMILMIFSGVVGSKENAQSQVSIGVGINAGITVFSLTIQWGIVLISGRIDFKKISKALTTSQSERETSILEDSTTTKANSLTCSKEFTILKETGVCIDKGTCYTAGIMLLSLIPFVVLQLVFVFNSLSANRIITSIALAISSLSLLIYIIYQIWNPWMQKRSLKCSKIDTVRTKYLKHVQSLQQLVNQEGKLNPDLTKGLFAELDANNDGYIDQEEMKKLVSNTFSPGNTKILEEGVDKIMNFFDKSDDGRIDLNEFIKGFEKWLLEAEKSASKNDFFFKDTSQQLLKQFEDKSKRLEKIMSKILMHFEGQPPKSESLIIDQWEPNMKRIHELFNELDTDKDEYISLKQLITGVNFGSYQLKEDKVLEELSKEFNPDGNASSSINEQQFAYGFNKYLNKAVRAAYISGTKGKNIIKEFDRIMWSQQYGMWDICKSVAQLIGGILVLTFLGRPLTNNILQLSNAVGFPSFIFSFIVVPLAMNAKPIVAAILPAGTKSDDGTASLTFSEIYSGVIMNNMSGLTTLLAVVYAKGLVWTFSAEVVTILVVCGAIGTLAFLRRTYQLWTSILAFLLYPFSIAFFYIISRFL